MTEPLHLTVDSERHRNRESVRKRILNAVGPPVVHHVNDGVHSLDRITMRVAGLLSPDDARRLQTRLQRLDGVETALVRFRDETAIVTVRDGRLEPSNLLFVIEAAGFTAWYLPEPTQTPEEERADAHRLLFLRALYTVIPAVLIISISVVVRVLGLGSDWLKSILINVQFVLLLGTLAAGRELFLSAARKVGWRSAAREVPLALAATVSLFFSLVAFLLQAEPMFDVCAAIVAAYPVGTWLESVLLRRSERHFRKLTQLRPRWAVVQRENGDFKIAIHDIIVEDRILVRPGEVVPVDGVILNDGGIVDESALMGSGFVVQKSSGKRVFAGSTNGDSLLVVAPRRTGQATVLGHILRVVEDARDTRAEVQKRGDRVAAFMSPVTLVLSVLTFIWWWFQGVELGAGLWFSLSPALAVLVVTTPWALGWASAVSVMAGMTQAARQGVLLRDAEALEAIRAIDVMLFEKAGTLTSDQPEVETIEVVGGMEAEQALRLIVALESQSDHAVAKAFVRYVHEHLGADVIQTLPQVTNLREIPGRGVTGRVGGHDVAVGIAALLKDKFIEVPPVPETELAGTYYYLAVDNQTRARALLYDPTRKDAAASVARVKAANVQTLMVTASDESSAQKVAKIVGIEPEHVRAGIHTKQHAEVARVIGAAGYRVGVVGNSDSDQTSLKAAHVAFALIPRGSRLPPERYSVSLLRPGSGGVITALDVATRTFRIIRHNIFGSACLMLLAIPAAIKWIPVHLAILLMLGGVTAVGLNGLRNRVS